MAKKYLRTKFKAICNECNHIFELNKEILLGQMRMGELPYSAKSSYTTIFCPKCNNDTYRVHFEYVNVYRKRCIKCNEMFDARETYMNKCPKCESRYLEVLSKFGA